MAIYILLLIFTPILSIPINFIALLKSPNNDNAIKYAILLSFGLAFLAYHIVPDMDMDLYRYYLRMDQMAEIQTLDAIRQEINSFNSELISNYLMYIISKTGYYGLYPAISVAYTYSVCLYVLISISRKRKYNSFDVRIAIFVLFAWLSSDAVVSGIRYNMAFTTLLLAFYLEYSRCAKKIICLPLYFAAMLIHSSFIVFVLLRILLPFMERYRIIRYVAFMIFATWSIYFGSLADIVSDLSFYNDGYLSEKLESYSEVHQSGRIGKYIVRFAKLLICIITSITLMRKHVRSEERDKNLKTVQIYNTANALIVIGAQNRLIYVSRFFQVLTSFIPFFIMDVLKDNNQRYKVLISLIVVITSLFFLYDQQSTLGMHLSTSIVSLLFRPIFIL